MLLPGAPSTPWSATLPGSLLLEVTDLGHRLAPRTQLRTRPNSALPVTMPST